MKIKESEWLPVIYPDYIFSNQNELDLDILEEIIICNELEVWMAEFLNN